MNYYVIIEGEIGSKNVYKKWITGLNDKLTIVERPDDLTNNCVYLLAAGGYPEYEQIIDDAVDDIKLFGNIDCFVIAVDSEDFSYQEKYDEIISLIKLKKYECSVEILIQHFCLETWALGNIKFGPRNPKNSKILEYKNKFNVLIKDPELLPDYPKYELNRAKFAFKYLKAMAKNTNPRLTYSKTNTKILCHKSYLPELINRYEKTNHIKSFSNFIKIFK